MSKFLPTSRFKWIDPKDFDLNKYNKKYNNKYNNKYKFVLSI